MLLRSAAVLVAFLISLGNAVSIGRAAVVVLANRTEQDVSFTLSSKKTKLRDYKVGPGEVIAVPMTRAVELSFSAGAKLRQARVFPNEIYCFVGDKNALQLKQIALSSVKKPPQTPPEDEEDAPDDPAQKSPKVLLRVPVKLFVDQAEPSTQAVWEKRLRRRVGEVSNVLQRYCRVRLDVVAVGTWHSDEGLLKLSELLDDFQTKAPLGKAQVAIGFTGQRTGPNEDHALGCTKAALHTHILLSEYRSRSEAGRIEVLLHEVGHFLGACHSPEGDSVMRPKLGDGRANLRAYRMGFDPLNTLAMNLVVEEIASRPIRSLAALRAPTRQRLIDVYSTLERLMPQDPAPSQYRRLVGPPPLDLSTVRSLSPEVLEAVRSVVAAIAADARRTQTKTNGDALTERYVRLAAAKCRQLPAEHAATAFALGSAIALDRTALLRSLEIKGIPWSKIESPVERRQRLEVLGEPTMQGRASLAQSFLVSAALLMLADGQAVSAVGLQEELLLLQGGDRFSFDELMAGLSGFLFATQLDAAPELLEELATSFRVADYVPSPKGLPPPISRREFHLRFGSMADERFLKPQDALRRRLMTLPGYQPRPDCPTSRKR